MPPVDPTLQQTFTENVWLHFFQMGHSSSTSARPSILVRGEGSRVWDQDGNAYIDALAGLFCVNAGYGRHEIVEVAPHEQLAAREVHPAELRPALEELLHFGRRHLVHALLLPDVAHLAAEVAVIGRDERHLVGQRRGAHVGAENRPGEAELACQHL